MTVTEQAAIARITLAVADKPLDRLSYSEVRAEDVVTVGGAVATGAHDDNTRDLFNGAQRAVRGHGRDVMVFQTTEHLRRLLELAQPAPTPSA